MRVGVIGAMEQEIVILRNQMIHSITWKQAGYIIYTGYLYNIEVALLKSGIGKVSAALSTTLLINYFNPEIIINTGSAGSLIPLLKVGDVIISREVCYHDVDITAFGYELGQMAECPVSFHAAPSLITLAEKTIERLNLNSMCGLIVSGDTFINNIKHLIRIHKIFPQAIAVEMEATAIAHVCYQFNIPFVVVRVISDIADKISHLDFKKFLAMVSQSSSYLIMKMIQSLGNK